MKYICLVMLCGLGCSGNIVQAGAFGLGLGLGFVDSQDSESFEGGWDILVGYSEQVSDDWHIGGQLHLLRGWTGKDSVETEYEDSSMFFESTALYLTLHPDHDWFRWLELKTGIVSAEYLTSTSEWDGTGSAYGLGLVIPDDKFRLHLLDVHRYRLGGEEFNVFTISLFVLIH